jgi:hypothetical protein
LNGLGIECFEIGDAPLQAGDAKLHLVDAELRRLWLGRGRATGCQGSSPAYQMKDIIRYRVGGRPKPASAKGGVHDPIEPRAKLAKGFALDIPYARDSSSVSKREQNSRYAPHNGLKVIVSL